MHLFFQVQSLQLLIFCMDDQEFLPIWCFFMSSLEIESKLNIFLLLHLISSFLHGKSLFILCAYVSTKSNDCIFLSSFELNAILLISSVKALCFSLLNLCCVFNVSLLFFVNSFDLL